MPILLVELVRDGPPLPPPQNQNQGKKKHDQFMHNKNIIY